MKKRIEHEELLREVLADVGDVRATSLGNGLAALRRKQARRRFTRLALVAIPTLLFATLWIVQHRHPKPAQIAQSPSPAIPIEKPRTIEGTPIRVIGDEELLTLFKGRPVALLGEPGHQRLVLFDEKVNLP